MNICLYKDCNKHAIKQLHGFCSRYHFENNNRNIDIKIDESKCFFSDCDNKKYGRVFNTSTYCTDHIVTELKRLNVIKEEEKEIENLSIPNIDYNSNYNIIEVDTSIDYEKDILDIYEEKQKNVAFDEDNDIRDTYLPNMMETNELDNISVLYNMGYKEISTQALLDNLYQNHIKGIEMDFDYISIKENKNIYILYNEDKEKINLDEINDINHIKFKKQYEKVNKIQTELAEFLLENGLKNQDDLINFIKRHKNNDVSSKNKIIKLKMQIGMHDIKMKSLDLSILSFKYKKTKYKFYKNIKNFHILYNSIKEENNKLLNKIDSIIKEFEEDYIVGLYKCKIKSCNEQCHEDVGYCLTHYPDICSKCNKILGRDERLNTNKKHNIENCCNSCTQELFFNNYVNEYNYKDIIHVLDENDRLYKTKLSLSENNYLDMKKDAKLLNGIDNPSDLLEKEIIELYGYTFDENSEFNKYNDFTKYKLYNRITRSKDLIDDFGEKLLHIKIKPSFYAYMGKQEYSAFKRFLNHLLNKDEIENDYFSDDDKPPEKTTVTKLVFS